MTTTYKNTGIKFMTEDLGVLAPSSEVSTVKFDDVYAEVKSTAWDSKVTESPPLITLQPPTERFLFNSTNKSTRTETTSTGNQVVGGSGRRTDWARTTTTNVIETTNDTTASARTEESLVPYMRQRRVYFDATGLKPNSAVYAVFDNFDVTMLCTPITLPKKDGLLVVSNNGRLAGFFDIPANRFKNGIREFKLVDSLEEKKQPATTKAIAKYTSQGIKSDTMITQLTTTRQQVVASASNTETWSAWTDPVAQTFAVETTESGNGVFIKGIDLYFAALDPNDEIMVEIRGVTNGYPNSTRLYDHAVTKKPTSECKESPNGSVATHFEFDTPIYLPSGYEYAFVVLCNTDASEIWCSELGKRAYRSNDVLNATGEIISKQPYLGSMFISQNSTTWSTEQTKDVKFKLYKCRFKPSGQATFINNNSDVFGSTYEKLMAENCLSFTQGSREIRLNAIGHGWQVGDKFILDLGSDVEDQIFGIPVSDIERKVQTVKSISETYITFDVNSAATGEGTGGGNYCSVKGWVVGFTMGQLLVRDTILDKTTANYILNSRTWNNYQNAPSGQHNMDADEIIDFKQFYAVKHDGDGGVTLNCNMTTEDRNISPIIQSHAIGLETHLSVINSTDYLSAGNTKNKDSSPAKYIQKPVTLINPANEIKVMFEANLPANTSVAVYYKTGNGGLISPTEEWVRMPIESGELVYTDNPQEFRTQSFLKTFNNEYSFDTFQVMVVLMGSRVVNPRFKNYRAIALNK